MLSKDAGRRWYSLWIFSKYWTISRLSSRDPTSNRESRSCHKAREVLGSFLLFPHQVPEELQHWGFISKLSIMEGPAIWLRQRIRLIRNAVMTRRNHHPAPCDKYRVILLLPKACWRTVCTYLLALHVPGGHKNSNIPIREISAEFFCSQ